MTQKPTQKLWRENGTQKKIVQRMTGTKTTVKSSHFAVKSTRIKFACFELSFRMSYVVVCLFGVTKRQKNKNTLSWYKKRVEIV